MTIKDDVLVDLMAAREHLDEAIKRVQAVPDGLPTEGNFEEHREGWWAVDRVLKDRRGYDGVEDAVKRARNGALNATSTLAGMLGVWGGMKGLRKNLVGVFRAEDV